MRKLIFLLICFLLAFPCFSATYIVDPNGSADYTTIQDAIDDSNDWDKIVVADDIYIGVGNYNIDFKGLKITVRSESGPENCIIDCENVCGRRGFYFHSGEDANSILSGFKIKRGRSEEGGGVHCTGSSPRIEDCIIVDCTGYGYPYAYGGGIYCASNSKPWISHCTIKGNQILGGDGFDFGMPGGHGLGGGIYVDSDSHALIEHCVIVNNVAEGGVGNCMIPPVFDGTATGGGIYGNVTINKSMIMGNIAAGGSGSCNWGGWAFGGGIYGIGTITNCMIVGNRAIGGSVDYDYGGCSYGGGICGPEFSFYEEELFGPLEVINCTISDNVAEGGEPEGTGYGGGIAWDKDPISISNSIIWDNDADNEPEIFGSVLVSYSDVQGGYSGTGNINTDPCFAGPNEDDYHLQSAAGRWDSNSESWVIDANTSACIDAGDPTSGWTAELWPHGKCINMGAYGGTAEASMSLSDVGNIADLNEDGSVDALDLELFVEKWPYQQVLLREDLDRNGAVNFVDFNIFADEWLWEE